MTCPFPIKNSSPLERRVNFSRSPLAPLKCGSVLEKSLASAPKAGIDVSCSPMSSQKLELFLNELESPTVGSPLYPRKKIWKDRLSSSKLTILTTQLSGILDRVSTSKEKVLTPFWTTQSKEISKKLWLPTKIDYADLVLSSSKESSPPTMGTSWFSIKNTLPLKETSLLTSFQSSQYSLPASLASEPLKTQSKQPSKPLLKTLKMRILPTNAQKAELKIMYEQYRWYYNAVLNIVYNHYGRNNFPRAFSYQTIRDLVKKYEYVEEIEGDFIVCEFKYDEHRKENPKPTFWDKIHNRIPRGAIDKFVSSINSSITNSIATKKKFMTREKKDIVEELHFEDICFPAMIKEIESRYWYTPKNGKRKTMTFKQIFKTQKHGGLEIIHDKGTDDYFIHYPVSIDWFPENDKRIESQDMLNQNKGRMISLDPGIRKFLVGYDPAGKSIMIGEGACKELIADLLKADKDKRHWKTIKNKITELHWKTISFLIKNYDTILLPDFRVSEMLKKKKLGRKIKRLMSMFSFYSFREKLKYKCKVHHKQLLIVDESYTSKTCTQCGVLNDVGSNEVYKCTQCKLVIDRDVLGSRNIFIKNVSIR